MKAFYVRTKDGNIPVSKDIYYAYYKSKWHEKYDAKKRLDKEFSFESLCESGFSVELKMTVSAKPLEDEVITKIMIEKMKLCLAQLTEDELFLITELFFYSKSIREVSAVLSIPRSTIQRKRDKILKKLLMFLNKTE